MVWSWPFSNISTKTITPITTIINMSMQDGVVPDDFKQGTKELLSYLK